MKVIIKNILVSAASRQEARNVAKMMAGRVVDSCDIKPGYRWFAKIDKSIDVNPRNKKASNVIAMNGNKKVEVFTRKQYISKVA